jgi:tyrosine-specific transport protein
LGITQVTPEFFRNINWKFGFLAYPMFITSFGFHGVLPSLHAYVSDKKSLQISILIGTTLTLLVYIIWQFTVMGIVPTYGSNSLTFALAEDQTAITPLKFYLSSPLLGSCAQIFYFSAIATSFLGVGLGLIDFLLDSFKINQTLKARLFCGFCVYIPSFLIAQTNLRIFYLSLKYGGGIACFYLLILLPLLLFVKKRKNTAILTK